MPCTFCGSDATLTNEHVFPQWSGPVIRHPDAVGPGTYRRVIARVHDEEAHEYPGMPVSVTVRCACASCNNGWMSELENAAKPYLKSMIEGHQRAYYEAGRRLIATWATKTALVSGAKFENKIPADFYRELHETRAPLKNSRIWLARAAPGEQHYIDYRPMRIGPGQETFNGVAGLLALGQLAFYVVAWEDEPPWFDELDEFAPAMTPWWPSTGREVAWMPKYALDHAGLDRLADSIAKLADGPPPGPAAA